ncbi:MAG: S41 family peptidase [Caldilineae bacterium]|nr:MAG: S41 family peptidase [Caldilineae bacterium]
MTTYVQYNNGSPSVSAATADSPANFALFWEVWRIVEDQFYDGVPQDSSATYGAIKGALAALNDPYTIFVEPQPRALEKAELEGQFGGIGAYVYRDEQNRVLLNPMVDSPAEKAGLQKDDVLLQVDDTPIRPEMSTDEVVLLIRGEVGTTVTLLVSRQGAADPISLTIERAIIETPSVAWRLADEDPTIGYVQISLFSNRTSRELDRALTDLRKQGATRFILDLRGNGGGLLEAAIDVASKFLSEGVVLTEKRRNADPTVYRVRGGYKLLYAPLVVLVDGGTASASEIVAGALQDYGRATLIGERTYGKGSVQLVYDLSDQSSVHVTVARWFTPNNHSIDGTGIAPDIEVLFSEEDHAAGRDPQYLRAIEELQTQP